MIGDSYFLNDYNWLCSIAVVYSFCLTSLYFQRRFFPEEVRRPYTLLGSDSKGSHENLIAKEHGHRWESLGACVIVDWAL